MEERNDLKVTPEKVIEELSKKDIIITYEEAALIIDFFLTLAKITIKHFRNYEKG